MKPLFTAHSLVSWVFGLALLVVPVPLLTAYGITLNPGGMIISQLLGGALIGLGVVSWFARRANPSDALRAIILGDVVLSVLGCVVSIYGVLSTVSNALGWVNVLLYGFFAVGFGALAAGKATSGKAPASAHS